MATLDLHIRLIMSIGERLDWDIGNRGRFGQRWKKQHIGSATTSSSLITEQPLNNVLHPCITCGDCVCPSCYRKVTFISILHWSNSKEDDEKNWKNSSLFSWPQGIVPCDSVFSLGERHSREKTFSLRLSFSEFPRKKPFRLVRIHLFNYEDKLSI